MAERVHPAPAGSAANRSRAANTTPDVPSATDSGPGPVDADPERARRLVAARPRRPALRRPCAPDTAGLSSTGRQPRRVELQRAQHLFAPAPSRDVEQQRPGSVGDVGRVLAAQPQAHVVLGQRDPRDLRVDLRLVAAQPQELRRGEARQRAVARQRDQPLETERLLDLRALGGGALVVPQDRRAQRPGRRRRARRARASGPTTRFRPAGRRRAKLVPAPPRSPPTSRPGPARPSRRAGSTAGSRIRRGRGRPPRDRSPGP